MRAAKLFVITAAGLLMASCGPALTLNPLFEESELVLEPALVGTWGEGETLMKFESGDRKTYKLTYRDGSKVSVFEAKLGRLGGQLFMDIYPVDKQGSEEGSEAYAPLVPMHTLMKVEIEDDQLVLYLLDSDWVQKQLDEANLQLDAEHVLKTGDDLFITLSTDQLQDLVRNHACDDEAFPRSDPLPRIQ